MFDDSRSFITRAFLRAEFDLDYRAWAADEDAALLKRLQDWDGRLRLSETQAEGAFTQTFFVDTWGYGDAGRVASGQHTIIAKFPVPGEGAGGGKRCKPRLTAAAARKPGSSPANCGSTSAARRCSTGFTSTTGPAP